MPQRGSGALVSDLYDGRLLMRPAVRRHEVCIAISAALIAVLGFVTVVHLSLLGSMRPDVASVFFRALALSGMLALVARFSQTEGYRCLSLMRALGVVKCQFALV